MTSNPPFPPLNCATYQADTQEMPNVDDYIAQKAAVYRLQQDMTNWERKVSSCAFKIGGLQLRNSTSKRSFWGVPSNVLHASALRPYDAVSGAILRKCQAWMTTSRRAAVHRLQQDMTTRKRHLSPYVFKIKDLHNGIQPQNNFLRSTFPCSLRLGMAPLRHSNWCCAQFYYLRGYLVYNIQEYSPFGENTKGFVRVVAAPLV